MAVKRLKKVDKRGWQPVEKFEKEGGHLVKKKRLAKRRRGKKKIDFFFV